MGKKHDEREMKKKKKRQTREKENFYKPIMHFSSLDHSLTIIRNCSANDRRMTNADLPSRAANRRLRLCGQLTE